MNPLQTIRSPRDATAILAHALRPRILAHAREPISASELARRLTQPRQRVNYHVRQLEAAGFLEPAGQQRKRNMVEQQYLASARAYVLMPEVLGEVAPDADEVGDAASASHLVAVCARAQSDVAEVMESAQAAGLRVRTMSLQSEVHFESIEQRAEFTRALTQAISEIIAKHTSATGRPFRMILGCYPTPKD